ncbi:MFS family permease [Variovorax boronicumulans]|uniref:Major facilitator superfamily MFS_1 n=1 Tax=Variovorax paradoxus (strain EPS) TaxID=595537 RepID=E6V5P4_VARPE|nr:MULTISPECIES: MFS transporter [Variovorax]ADU35941.1 major facilitator superfamily MFS_1 [Variovorax paradoxus EPS]MDP9990747.1 MFS family permease [Variovorax boronicumulans]MDQ0002775.1 MFS family permease [Variovorax boronicumulans]
MTALSSDIPARLDRLPWSRWHWRVVIALGVAWILDGLEVTLVGSIGAVLERPDTLGLTAGEIGWSGSIYIAGAVVGALVFGRLTDRLGRKKLFLITLAVYTVGTLATAFSPDFAFFALCRFVTGLGIGGEYAAINSAIDELIPARVRGRVNLAINGSFWIGAALGAALSLVLLDARVIGPVWGWRAGFALGAVLAVAILLVRRHVPESPRWLIAHGRVDEAERIVAGIEHEVQAQHGPLPAPRGHVNYTAARANSPSMREVARVLLRRYTARSVVAAALMISQAFFYNAIFFTYALVLTRFYGVPEGRVALYIFPFALGNVLGPLLLGPLFDSVGRRRMIALTYVFAGVGLALTGWAFMNGWLDARSQALCWSAVFFLASAAASSAYLTVSEVFPLEMRAMAIAIFYAIGMGAGGFVAPVLFGELIETGSRGAVMAGYLIGAALVIVAGLLALRYAADAERKPLEEVAPPLSSEAGGER